MGSVVSSSSSSSPSPLPLPPPSSSPTPSPPPSSPPAIKHEVFVSFRGGDIRDNFLSHLREAFDRKGIDAFIDDQLERGQEISPALLRAIEESQISVVIFSENYADSTWCLEELVKILECSKNHGQTVIPVFYKTEPSEVRQQTGSYADAFEKHKDRFKEDLDKVQKWRDDLREAANLSGLVASVVKPESALVEKIVGDVWEKLINTPSSENNTPSSDNMQQVGIESKITKLEEMLRIGDNDVRKVGICGIGGIGKTTLAKAIFDKIYCQFPEGHFFVGSVREASEKKELNLLKQELYPEKLKGRNTYGYYPYTKKRFRPRKLFIVFDDVTTFQQIEALIGDLDHCFDLGSRFIITSRSQQVLKNCGVNDIYMVEELCFNDSLKLFCWHAFKQNHPKIDYRQLSKGVVVKVGGVPLALKVLGSSLLGKTKAVWESAMEKLEKNFDRNIHEVLKISYEELDDDQQNIFLDIACFFKGWNVDHVKAFMKGCGFFPDSGIDALIDKSLTTISYNMLTMHDLLQAMGKEIVRQESTNPGERTRLFNYDDVYDVLTQATGTKKIEGIHFDTSNIGDITLHRDAFKEMHNLRFLQIRNFCNNEIYVPQDFKFRLIGLRYLKWERYPLKSLQYLKNLVILNLCESNIEQLWNGDQQFHHLKEIKLRHSRNLTRFPNIRAPKLEVLNLGRCTSLIEMPSSFQHLTRLKDLIIPSCPNLTSVPELPVNLRELVLNRCSSLIEIPSSIQHLTNLGNLSLTYCTSLTSMPDCSGLMSLQPVLIGCSKLERFPELPNTLRDLFFIDCTSLLEIPSSFQHLRKLELLIFDSCESLTSIPDLTGLQSLTDISIRGCTKLRRLPELPNSITTLRLSKIPIEELPPSYEHLCTLLELQLIDCSRLKSRLSIFGVWKSLETLCLKNCPTACALSISRYEDGLVGSLLPPIDFLRNLTKLTLSGCGITEIPDSVCCLTSLQRLELDRNNFERIPESIVNLSKLSYLNISYCERLKVLPKLPWACIDALNCTSLQELSCPSFPNCPVSVVDTPCVLANFINCFKLDQNSLDSVVKDTQLEIQDKSPSNFKLCRWFYPTHAMCYPGSEIPKQFTFQCSRSFIDVKLPPDYNLLCFALCAVVSFPDQCDAHSKSDLSVQYKYYVKSKKGGHLSLGGSLFTQNGSLDYNMRSSHVFIGFGCCFLRQIHVDEFTFRFYSWRKDCKVKKCGVHLMFGTHLEALDESEVVDKVYNKQLREEENESYGEESEEEEDESYSEESK